MNAITEICLKQAQLILNSHIPVFNLDIKQLQQFNFKFNLAISKLITAKFIGIDIRIKENEFNSTVSGSGLTCLEVVNTHTKEIQLDSSISNATTNYRSRIIRKELIKLSKRDIFFVNDIITLNSRSGGNDKGSEHYSQQHYSSL